MPVDIMRVCKICHAEKHLDQFRKRRQCRLGRGWECLECRRQRSYHDQNNPPQVNGSKVCPRCAVEKNLTEYSMNKSNRDGRAGWCRPCVKDSTRALKLRDRLGVSWEKVQKTFADQGYRCGSCQDPIESTQFHVDHDHATNKFRGILCHHCNTALGLLRDDLVRISRLSEYLRKSKEGF